MFILLANISQRQSIMDANINDGSASREGMPKRDGNAALYCQLERGTDITSIEIPTEVTVNVPSGLILKSGRVRLPDKLMEFLNKEVAPEALYWMPDGESFAIDTEKAQDQLLNQFFRGTKLSSFLRSISRW